MEKFQIKYFAERLKKIAKNDFGGVGKLAVAMGMTQPGLSNYMSGKVEPGISFVFKLAKLGCDINWLLTGEETDVQKLKEENKKLKDQLELIKSMASTNITASGKENIIITGSGNSVK